MSILVIGVFFVGLLTLASLPLWKIRYDYASFDGEFNLFHKKGIKYMSFRKLPMFDWDMPDIGHLTEECITITKREEVPVILKEFVEANPQYSFTLEKTPGGVRGWLHKEVSVKEWIEIAESVKCDSMYIQLIKNRCVWSTRISAKARPGDFVATNWCVIGDKPMHKDLAISYKAYKESLPKVVRHVMTCGLPGSGKSTYANNLAESGVYYYIGTDRCREELYGNESIQGSWTEVWERVIWHVNQAKSLNKPVIYDGCNLTTNHRKEIISLVGGEWEIAWRDVDADTCCAQQLGRQRQVPEEVIHKMASYFKAPSLKEDGVIAIYNI